MPFSLDHFNHSLLTGGRAFSYMQALLTISRRGVKSDYADLQPANSGVMRGTLADNKSAVGCLDFFAPDRDKRLFSKRFRTHFILRDG